MSRDVSLVDRVIIPDPCPMKWSEMHGDRTVRHCTQCNLNVHHLSEMTRVDAERLLANAAGKHLCVQMYKRPDGKVITADDRWALRRFKLRLGFQVIRRHASHIAAAIGLGFVMQQLGGCVWPGRTGGKIAAPSTPAPEDNGTTLGRTREPENIMVGDVCVPPVEQAPPQSESTQEEAPASPPATNHEE